MTAYVCVLRGVNVTGVNKVAMSELRAMFEQLGHANVSTYIQSGNVVFTSDRDSSGLAGEIRRALESTLGLNVPAILRSGSELADVLERNPLDSGGRDPARLHVTFLGQVPEPSLVAILKNHASPPDEFVIDGCEVYLHCPGGYGNTKLNNTFWERGLRVTATTRNWKTVAKLTEMAASF